MADVTHRHLEMNFLFYDFHHIFASHGRVGGYDVLEPERDSSFGGRITGGIE